MLKKRSQSAVELMIILAVGLAILIGILNIFFRANDSFSGQLESKKARAAVDSIADAAEMVHQQGVGSKTRVYVTLPENVNHFNATSRLLQISLNAGGSSRDVYRTLDFNISGSIPAEPGSLFVYVESKGSYVRISDEQSVAYVCGNSLAEANESCDGTELNGQTCRTQGFSSGTLGCLGSCSGFDTSQCVAVVTSLQLKPQSCAAAVQEDSQNTYPDNCDGTYPSGCSNDKVSCDDSSYEDHIASSGNYCGARLGYYNTSINDCTSISNVMICHQWHITSSAPTGCHVAVARNYEQWQLTKDDYNGAESNTITDISSSSQGRLYITETDRNIWESADAGNSWSKIENDYSGESGTPQILASSPNGNLYIAESDEDIWRSVNGGLIWTNASANMNGGNGGIKGIASNSSDALYIVDVNADVWVSLDNGTSWTAVSTDFSGADSDSGTEDIVVDDNSFLYIIREQDVYRSTNSGTSWTKINDDFNGALDSNNAIEMVKGNMSLFIIDGSEDVYKSVDNASSWLLTTVDFNGANGGIAGTAYFDGKIYAADAVSDIWNATDTSLAWVNVSTSCNTSEPAMSCANATSSFSWQCSDFFGTGISGAFIRQNAVSNEGSKSCRIDLLYYNVSYVS